MKLDIVSAERALFAGEVLRLTATGEWGELGVEPGHAPLLTRLKPGAITCTLPSGELTSFYISGGIVEIQPDCVTVLADTAVRAHDLDESAAEVAAQAARDRLSQAEEKMDYATALSDLAQATAQLRLIKSIRSIK